MEDSDCEIAVGFCFYEDSVETVKRAIESVKDHVQYIFAIDGKYKFYESDRLLSTPDVREYLKSVPNVILYDAPNLTEADKRQKYMDLCKIHNIDVIIIMDSDEWFTERTKWEPALKYIEALLYRFPEPKIHGVRMQFSGTEGIHPRVWMKPKLISYTKCHNFWIMDSGVIFKSTLAFPPIPDFYMRSNDKLRNPENLAKTFEYQKKLMAYEKPFKKNYRLNARG